MATAEFWQRGEALDYQNETSATIKAGTIVVFGTQLGVAGTDIEPHTTGSVHVGGVWEIKKTASGEIAMGAKVYFDGTGITTTASSNTEAGYAAAKAAASDTTVLVKLRG